MFTNPKLAGSNVLATEGLKIVIPFLFPTIKDVQGVTGGNGLESRNSGQEPQTSPHCAAQRRTIGTHLIPQIPIVIAFRSLLFGLGMLATTAPAR